MNEESTPVIYMATVSAPVNIACIKYWGKASIPLNTPINDSVSVTLDQSDLRAGEKSGYISYHSLIFVLSFYFSL